MVRLKYIIQFVKNNHENKLLEYSRISKNGKDFVTKKSQIELGDKCTIINVKLAPPKQQISYNGLPELYY